MAGVSVASLQALNSAAVLKFQVGGLLIADESAAIPDESTLVDAATGNVTVPVGYVSGGLVTTDGLTFARSLSADKTMSWQSLAAVRSDVTEDSLQVKVKFQETNAVTLALQEGLTLAAATTALSGAGFNSRRDTSGTQPKRRIILIAQDTKLGITLARILPNSSYAGQGDQAHNRGTELQYDATFDCLYDAVYGSDEGLAIGGPGWAALAGTTSESSSSS